MGKTDRNENPLAQDFTCGSLLKFAFPTMIMMIFMGIYTIGDTVMVSRFVNAVLDYVFMVPMDLGIAGSALGTGIGYVIPAAAGIVFFFRKKGTLSFTKPVLDFHVLAESCMNGSSEMVSQIAAAVTTFFFNLTMMSLLGETGVAAIAILIYSQFFLTTLYMGFSMGVAPVISFRYGAGNDMALKRIISMCFCYIGISSVGIWLLCLAGGNWLVRLFTGGQEAVYAAAAAGFRLFRNSFLFSGFNIFASSLFTALSNGKVSAIISFSRTFGFLMAGLLVLPGFLGVDGVWLAVPVAEVLSFVLAAFFVRRLFLTYAGKCC